MRRGKQRRRVPGLVASQLFIKGKELGKNETGKVEGWSTEKMDEKVSDQSV